MSVLFLCLLMITRYIFVVYNNLYGTPATANITCFWLVNIIIIVNLEELRSYRAKLAFDHVIVVTLLSYFALCFWFLQYIVERKNMDCRVLLENYSTTNACILQLQWAFSEH